jgi:hypothetical protein
MEDNNLYINNTFFDLDLIKSNIFKYSSQKLCEMVVCDRYFGLEQKISVICMEELARRRIAGDIFDFEDVIDKSYKELPVLNFEMPDLRTVLGQALKNKKQ